MILKIKFDFFVNFEKASFVMKALAIATVIFSLPAVSPVLGATEVENLRDRCAEQERQIRTLEAEIEKLHSQLALERRRARGAAPEASTSYVVKNGDTLSSIARRYDTTAEALMKLNEINDPTRLFVGQKLKLPGQPALAARKALPALPVEREAPRPAAALPDPKPDPKADDYYKVQRGDTLYGVAQKHNMSVAALRALNPDLQSDKIVVGQSLGVRGPARKPAARSTATRTISTTDPSSETPKASSVKEPESETKSKSASQTISSIIVMEETTFGDFAAKHDATPEQLNALNGLNLKRDITLAKGSELYVPTRQ